MKSNIIDLSTCRKGDILVSSLGAKLQYVGNLAADDYYDHKVKYIQMENGSRPIDVFGTRTNDGYVFKNNRKPETDHDIVKIMKITQIKINDLSKDEYKHPDAFIESCKIDGIEATEAQLEELNNDSEFVLEQVEEFIANL